MAASVQIVKLKNSITPRTSPPRRIGKCIGNSNAIFPMTTVGLVSILFSIFSYLLFKINLTRLCETHLGQRRAGTASAYEFPKRRNDNHQLEVPARHLKSDWISRNPASIWLRLL